MKHIAHLYNTNLVTTNLLYFLVKQTENPKIQQYLGETECVENCEEISEKVREGGLVGLWRRVRKAVASVIGGNGSEAGAGEGDHLVAPRVPYLREAVEEYDDVRA